MVMATKRAMAMVMRVAGNKRAMVTAARAMGQRWWVSNRNKGNGDWGG